MDDGGGVVWDRKGAAVATAGVYVLYAATVGHAIHRRGREVGSSPPYQHATAAPGSCISHAWPLSLSSLPLFLREDVLRGLERHAEFNRLRDKEQRGH